LPPAEQVSLPPVYNLLFFWIASPAAHLNLQLCHFDRREKLFSLGGSAEQSRSSGE